MTNSRFNIAEWVRYWASACPNKPALIFQGEEISYSRLFKQTSALAYWLEKRGLTRGDRLAVYMTNSPFFLLLFLACAKSGIIFVPINFRLTPQELTHIIENAEPKVLFFSPELEEKVASLHEKFPKLEIYVFSPRSKNTSFHTLTLADLPEAPEQEKTVDPEDPQVIMYTSGTTGFPKGAILPYRKTFFNVMNASFFLELNFQDVMIIFLPLFHSGGLFIGAAPMLYWGGTIVLEPKFKIDESIERISTYGITKFVAVPTIYKRILEDIDRSHQHLKLLTMRLIGGERVDHELISSYYRLGLPLRQIFGQTETSILLWGDEELTHNFRDSVGYPVFHSEVKLVDKKSQAVPPGEVGEIVVRGPILMKGYWRDTKQTADVLRKGWLHTGDLARQDEEGRFYIVGRKKDVYVSGGENVYPAEVERVLKAHPAILEAAVIGVSDERWGEVGMAFIVKRQKGNLTEKGIIRFCSDKLAKYKVPKYVSFVSILPKTSLGKTKKYLLKEQFVKNTPHEQT
jgi:fatty-acyl-CoA synthase